MSFHELQKSTDKHNYSPYTSVYALKNSTTKHRQIVLVNDTTREDYNRNTVPQHTLETSEQIQAKTSAASKKAFKQVRMQLHAVFRNGDFLRVSIIT